MDFVSESLDDTTMYCVWQWRIEDNKRVYKNCLYLSDTHIAYKFRYCPYCGKLRKEIFENDENCRS